MHWIGDPFDVRDYGADPTANTDSAGAINRALSSAQGSRPVFMPSGRYRVDSVIGVPSHTTLVMAPDAYVYRSFSGSTVTNLSNIFDTPPDSDIEIVGGNLGLTADRPTGNHLTFKRVSQLHVQDVWIGDTPPGGYMIWLYNQTNALIRRCILNNPDTDHHLNDGIHVESGRNIIISECFVSTGDDAIALGNLSAPAALSNVVVANCAVYSAQARGVVVYTESAQSVSNVTVQSVVGAVNAQGAGIEVNNLFDTSQARVTDVAIVGCHVQAPITTAEASFYNCSDCSVTATVLRSGLAGLYIDNASGIRAVNCTIKGNTSGVLEANGSDFNLVYGCDLRGNSTATSGAGPNSVYANNLT